MSLKQAMLSVGVVAALLIGSIMFILWDEGVFDGDEARTAPFFGPQEVGRLIAQLSEATEAQGVCYGWVIRSGRPNDIKPVTPSYPGTFSPQPPPQGPAGAGGTQGAPPGATPSPEPVPTGTLEPRQEQRLENEYELRRLDRKGVEYGSNLGVGIDPRQRPGQCANWVVLESTYGFSTRYNEWTYGRFEIKSSFDGLSKAAYERRLGQAGNDDIDGENGAARLRDAIGALPMLVAEKGLAPPVPAPAEPVVRRGANDEISNSVFTARNIWTVIGGLLIGLAVAIAVAAAVRNRRGSTS